jgi:hypothetical protein
MTEVPLRVTYKPGLGCAAALHPEDLHALTSGENDPVGRSIWLETFGGSDCPVRVWCVKLSQS